MFEKIKNSILSINKVAGIELTFLSEDTITINCIMLEIKKGKAVITGKFYNLKTISDLEGKINEQTPVALVVNGKGIIHKKISVTDSGLPADILPGVNPNDFLFQTYNGFETPEIAIIRKNAAEKIIEEFTGNKVLVTVLSLAFYDMEFIEEFINHNGEIITPQYNLSFANKKVQHYKVNSAEEKEIPVRPDINVHTEYIKSNFIIAYAAALKLLSLGFKNTNSIQLPGLKANQEKITHASRIKIYAGLLLISFLFLLLLNFAFYNHYSSKNNELLSSNLFSLQQKSRIDSLKKSLSAKKDFLAKAGWLDDSRMISFYADRIGSTVPESVTLNGLNIYPALSKFSFSAKQWNFKQDTILIAGSCDDPSSLDAWVKEMSKIKNVRESRISSYLFKKQGETGIFNAEVLIK